MKSPAHLAGLALLLVTVKRKVHGEYAKIAKKIVESLTYLTGLALLPIMLNRNDRKECAGILTEKTIEF